MGRGGGGPGQKTPGSALKNWTALCGRAYGHILIYIAEMMPQALLKGQTTRQYCRIGARISTPISNEGLILAPVLVTISVGMTLHMGTWPIVTVGHNRRATEL